jgi:23S rRNA A2030 N6-methylase RlmJ
MDGITMEIIEIDNANLLPVGETFVLYEPPFQDSNELREVVSEFTRKYGYEPQTIYHLGKKWYVKKEVKK